MLYLRENIPSKLLRVEMSPSECFCIEIANLLLLYPKQKHSIQFHLENLNKSLASCSPNYKILTILGDFNISIDNSYIGVFMIYIWF